MSIGKIAFIIIPSKDNDFYKITIESIIKGYIYPEFKNNFQIFLLDEETKNKWECNTSTNNIINAFGLIEKIQNVFYSSVIIQNDLFFDTDKFSNMLIYIDNMTLNVLKEKNKLIATFGFYNDDFIIVNNNKFISYEIMDIFKKIKNDFNILHLLKSDTVDLLEEEEEIYVNASMLMKKNSDEDFKITDIQKYLNTASNYFCFKFSKNFFDNLNYAETKHFKLVFLNNTFLYKLCTLHKKYKFTNYKDFLDTKYNRLYYIQMILNYSQQIYLK